MAWEHSCIALVNASTTESEEHGKLVFKPCPQHLGDVKCEVQEEHGGVFLEFGRSSARSDHLPSRHLILEVLLHISSDTPLAETCWYQHVAGCREVKVSHER